jgi:hypothetical protein
VEECIAPGAWRGAIPADEDGYEVDTQPRNYREAGSLMDTASHVIQRVLNARFLTLIPILMDSARHDIRRILTARFLSYMAFYDVASTIHESLLRGGSDRRCG